MERFVVTLSMYEWGLVCHAVAGAMQNLLEDWWVMVTQLECLLFKGQLTLQVNPSSPNPVACYQSWKMDGAFHIKQSSRYDI